MRILFVILFFWIFLLSCKNEKNRNSQVITKQENKLSSESILTKYFSTIDIPYLLKEEVDSILLNKEKFKNDKAYRNQFKRKARGRRSGIRKLDGQSQIPAPFRRYLLPSELTRFNKDSLSDFIILYELYKKREDKIRSISNYSLTEDEIQKLIQGSYKDSIYYKELSANRFKKDSIETITKFNKIKDSLQTIVHPVDSILPFGPKPFGRLLENNINSLGFHVKIENETNASGFPLNNESYLTEEKKQSRKDIYDIWRYYLKFHPYADADLSEDYQEKLLPPIENYKVLHNSILASITEYDHEKKYNPINGNFVARLENIGIYEVYYTTTGVDSYNGCGLTIKENNCCFAKEGYDCSSIGYLILYNRKEKFATVVPAFILNNTQSFGFQLQFSYVSKETIYIYQGYSMYNWFVNKGGKIKRFITNKDGSTTGAKGYKSVGIANNYRIEIQNNGNLIINEQCIIDEQINFTKSDRLKNKINYTKKRDSLINEIQPLIVRYPFGPSILKGHNFPNGVFQVNETKNDNVNKIALDSIFKFYNAPYHSNSPKGWKFPAFNHSLKHSYTLPIPHSINKINIGTTEFWNKEFLQNFYKESICGNLDFPFKDINDHILPSIGKYEIYFSAYSNVIGMLTFYDTVTKTANVINVLDIRNRTNFRFFYINAEKEIGIYQGFINDSLNTNDKTYKVTKTHLIKVLSNGEISVTKLKN